jgi:hypothetical protein
LGGRFAEIIASFSTNVELLDKAIAVETNAAVQKLLEARIDDEGEPHDPRPLSMHKAQY